MPNESAGKDAGLDPLRLRIAELEKALTGAIHGLRSFQYSNGAAEVAGHWADGFEAVLKNTPDRSSHVPQARPVPICWTEPDSWYALRSSVVAWNDPDKGRFVERVRRCDGVCSSGECILLHAIAAACDFAWLADELADGRVWRRMDNASGEWRCAVTACIMAGCDADHG